MVAEYVFISNQISNINELFWRLGKSAQQAKAVVSGALLASRDKKHCRVQKGNKVGVPGTALRAGKLFATVELGGEVKNIIKQFQNQGAEMSCYQLK